MSCQLSRLVTFNFSRPVRTCLEFFLTRTTRSNFAPFRVRETLYPSSYQDFQLFPVAFRLTAFAWSSFLLLLRNSAWLTPCLVIRLTVDISSGLPASASSVWFYLKDLGSCFTPGIGVAHSVKWATDFHCPISSVSTGFRKFTVTTPHRKFTLVTHISLRLACPQAPVGF